MRQWVIHVRTVGLSLALLCAVGVLGGCAQRSVNVVEAAQIEGRPTIVPDKRVQTDGSLARKIGIIEVREGMTEGDLRRVQVELVNRTRSAMNVNYRFDWYDVNGMAVDTPLSIWKPVQVQGGQPFSIAAVAPHPRAVDFRVMLLEARR
jgi:uncharacterized protein YcfL